VLADHPDWSADPLSTHGLPRSAVSAVILDTQPHQIAASLRRFLEGNREAADLGDQAMLRDSQAPAAAPTSSEVDWQLADLIRAVGHELRNPLSTFQSALQVLEFQGDAHVASRGRAIEILNRQSQRMAAILEDLSDLSRLIRGSLPWTSRDVDLRSLLVRAHEELLDGSSGPACRIRLELPDHEIAVRVDPRQTQKAIVHLFLQVASQAGRETELLVHLAQRGDRAILVCQGVEPGLSLAKLNAEMARGHLVSDGLRVGTGLCRRILDRIGGQIEFLHDDNGPGDALVLQIPVVAPDVQSLNADDDALAGSSTPHGGESYSILLVDDDADLTESLGALLSWNGHRVRVVHDGWDALEVARANTFDLVLIDIEMPSIDGLEVARRLRKMSQRQSRVLVGISGYADLSHCAGGTAPFDRFLAKPIVFEDLRRLFSSLPRAESA
jgi:CheY-like chemotaxis protein